MDPCRITRGCVDMDKTQSSVGLVKGVPGGKDRGPGFHRGSQRRVYIHIINMGGHRVSARVTT